MADDNSMPTMQQAVEGLVSLGRALHEFTYPKSELGLAGILRPHESRRLMEEIETLERVVETAACNPANRDIRSVLDVRRDLIPDKLDVRIIGFVVWHCLTCGDVGTSVGRTSHAAGLGSVEEMLRARQCIRFMLNRDVLVFRGENELLMGPRLVQLISGGSGKLQIVWTEETLKHEAEERQRQKGANLRKSFSPPSTNQAPSAQPSPANVPVPENLSSPKAIFNALRQTVLGMDDTDTLRRFSVAMSLHMRRANLVRQGIVPTTPCQTLCIAGESGVGKTFMVEEFCKIANLNYTIGNLAEVTCSGYSGLDLTDIYAGLFRNGAKRAEVEAGSIVFFDEADKRKINEHQGIDCTGASLQAELLRMVEGTDIQLGGRRSNSGSGMMLSTRDLAFCLAGCFSGVTEAMASKKRHLGFGSNVENVSHAPDIREALTTYFLPELCNRISTILYIKPPTLGALIQMAIAPHGVLEKQNIFLGGLGLILKPGEDAIRDICSYAHSSKTYARGVRSLFQALAEEAIFEEWKGELVIGAGDVRKAIEGLKPCEVGQK